MERKIYTSNNSNLLSQLINEVNLKLSGRFIFYESNVTGNKNVKIIKHFSSNSGIGYQEMFKGTLYGAVCYMKGVNDTL